MYNKSVFSIFLIPGENQATIEEHIESVRVPGSWATQVEVVAAASAFEVPIYYYSIDKKLQQYTWKVVHPYSSTKHTLKLPGSLKLVKECHYKCPHTLNSCIMTLYTMMLLFVKQQEESAQPPQPCHTITVN